jgi:hypothetical protein
MQISGSMYQKGLKVRSMTVSEFLWKLIAIVEIPIIRRMRLKISRNDATSLGVANIICFFIIVIYTLINGALYFPIPPNDDYFNDILWKIVMFCMAIFLSLSFYKEKFFTIVTLTIHYILLLFYGLFAILPVSLFFSSRSIIFYLWWLSLSFSLRYCRYAANQKKIGWYWGAVVLFIATLLKIY